MLSVSNDYKTALTQPKTIDAKIIIGADTITSDDLNRIKRSFNSGLFKTVAKMVEIDSNTSIDKGTTIEPQFGVYLDNAFEYASLGTYKTKDDPVLKKDTNSYQIVAYDKIVESMVDYELTSDDITYPCTVRALMIAIFTKLGWSTSGIPNSFVNSSSLIEEDVYSGLNMTYRDVLDELCTISCNFLLDINGVPTLMNKNFLATLTSKSGTSISITDAQNEQIQNLTLYGDTTQSRTPTPDNPVPINVTTGRQLITLSGKNVLQLNNESGYSYTQNGITYTYQSDGGIKAVGTATANSNVIIANNTTPNLREILLSGNYYLSGSVEGSSNDTYRIQVYGYRTDGTGFIYGYDDGVKIDTFVNKTSNFNIAIWVKSGQTIDKVFYPMLEMGDSVSSYEQYNGENYEINLGKNLTDLSTFVLGYVNGSTGAVVSSQTQAEMCSPFIKVEPNTSYTFSIQETTDEYPWWIGIGEYTSDTTNSFTARKVQQNQNYQTFTTNATTHYIRVSARNLENATKVQLEKGRIVTDWSAYTTPIELCKISTYQDKIYKDNDKWYLHKDIGKVVLNGTETGWWWNSASNRAQGPLTNGKYDTKLYSNYFKSGENYNDHTINSAYVYGTALMWIYLDSTQFTSLSQFQSWLSTHNTDVYYILATPTDTEITDTTLLEQLNNLDQAKTFKGINNITITSSNLSSPMSFDYVSEVETIDENYMCDTNVEIKDNVFFNSLVFSRSADSDNIYRQDETSVSNNGLHEFKVSNLQIISLDWRDNFIDEMWNYIKDFSYYAYDVNTVGITFLEPLDEYYLSTFGDTYKTILLNSDLTIGDGVNEKIYNNTPEETTTEYKYATSTDRLVNRATLIVDKQNNEIQGLVTTVNNNYQEITDKFNNYVPTSEYVTLENTVTTLQTSTYTKTEINTKLTDGSVTKVQTTSGTFDENGMRYEKTNAKTSTLINEKGVEVDNATTQSELFFAGYDENINQTIVRTDNINVRNFLTIGNNTRIQDYENGGGMFIL